ncbi:PH domain-containing protein [Paenibacillus sp. sgz500958]|uniref:PH domain-containing protein n=1 Tax=Paenibacillus sp. sgz500958 TaxID=3242475 RepID=UPI0036D41BA2
MRTSQEQINEYLNPNEEIVATAHCSINPGYVSRGGVLVATNERLLFCADHMFGEGLQWMYEYNEIASFRESKDMLLFPKKIRLRYKDEFIVFSDFTNMAEVKQLLKIVSSMTS